jgi:hypothetical protein
MGPEAAKAGLAGTVVSCTGKVPPEILRENLRVGRLRKASVHLVSAHHDVHLPTLFGNVQAHKHVLAVKVENPLFCLHGMPPSGCV